MATFTAVQSTDLTSYSNQTSTSTLYPMVGSDYFNYWNGVTSFGAYGVGIMSLLNGPVSGTVTDIFAYAGMPQLPLNPMAPPILQNLSFSGLSVDYTTVVGFFSATTQAASLDSLAIMLAGADTLNGSTGNDVLSGFAGADVINGGAGTDTASYLASLTGVTVSLANGSGKGGDAAGDTLTSIENLTGSLFRDTLAGDGNNNTLDGGDGNDTLIGGAGADSLYGGNGTDTASYITAGGSVMVDLTINDAFGSDSSGDLFFSIENLIGSNFADILGGAADNNRIQGMGGNDTLFGLGGNDTLIGGDDSDELQGGDGNDTLNGDDGNDGLYGSAGQDRLNGGDGDDMVFGGIGADILTGGAGNDTFLFETLDGTVDSIRDWNDGDRIQIDFNVTGVDLTIITTGTTTRGLEGEGIFYNSTTGRLYVLDSDAEMLTHFATLATKPASLDAGDFLFL